jgi:peptidoglycan biosynthesis protein MviN/MurJ (putative lipid II flippase)
MTGRHRAVVAVNAASAAVLVSVGTCGALLFGSAGLAAGSAASLAFQNGALWWLARRELGVSTHVGFETFSRHAKLTSLPSPASQVREQRLLDDVSASPVCPP